MFNLESKSFYYFQNTQELFNISKLQNLMTHFVSYKYQEMEGFIIADFANGINENSLCGK